MDWLLMFTSAPATTAPELSWTVPVNVPVSCATAAPEISRNTDKQKAMRTIFMTGSVGPSLRRYPSALRPFAAHVGAHERSADGSSRNCSVGKVQKCAWAPHPRLLLNLLKRIKYSYPAGVKRKNEQAQTFRFFFTTRIVSEIRFLRRGVAKVRNEATRTPVPGRRLGYRRGWPHPAYQRPFLPSFCFPRAFSSLLISAAGNGLSVGN